MKSFYSVVTVWADTPTTTADFPEIEKALAEWHFRKALAVHANGNIVSVRVLRISKDRILDVTPDPDDTNYMLHMED